MFANKAFITWFDGKVSKHSQSDWLVHNLERLLYLGYLDLDGPIMMLTASAVSVYRFQRIGLHKPTAKAFIGNQLNHIVRLYVNNLFVSKTYSKTDYRKEACVWLDGRIRYCRFWISVPIAGSTAFLGFLGKKIVHMLRSDRCRRTDRLQNYEWSTI